MNKKIKPVNPVIKALIQAPKHGGRHKGSRWKLFQEILEREIKERKDGQSLSLVTEVRRGCDGR